MSVTVTKRNLLLALLGGALIAGVGAPAHAQQPVLTLPATATTAGTNGNASGTVAVTNTFQQVWAATGTSTAPARNGCTIQNNGTHNMFVSEGRAAAAATLTNSVILAAGATYYCQVNGIVLKGIIAITGTATEAFYAAQY